MNRVKKLLSALLAVLTVISLLPACAFAATADSTHALNYHDVDYQADTPTGTTGRRFNTVGSSSIPSAYSSITEGKATAPKDQGDYGTCWAFSATSASEGGLIKNSGSAQDLSELQLAYFFYKEKVDPLGNATGDKTTPVGYGSYLLDAGGNSLFTMWGLANWTNGAPETALPYTAANIKLANSGSLSTSLANSNDIAHLQNAYIIPYSTSSSDRNNVKSAIMTYGSLSCAYYHSDSYLNESTGAYYCKVRSTNHAVSIVGWNDNYPASNFKSGCKPSANGAWLVKNSWGTDWGTDGDADPTNSGEGGYFWLSYYDASLASSGEVFAFDFEPTTNYKYNYQYDGSCGIKTMYVAKSNSVAAIYETKGLTSSQERIDAVGLGVASTNVSGTIYIYTGVTDNKPCSGKLVKTQKFSTTYEGFHTIEISDGPVVTKGQKYSVVVKFDNNCYVFIDKSYSGGWIRFVANTQKDKTYKVSSSGSITKLSSVGYTARVKAYTNDVSGTPVTPTTYTVTYNANGGSGAPAADTKTKGVALTLSSTKPVWDGHTFLGWSESSTATTATYAAGGSYTKDASTVLYAVWQDNSVPAPTPTYTVTYNANGGSGAPAADTKTKGVALTLSSTIPVWEGHTFLGWSESSTATTATYAAGGKYTKDAGTTLFAVWREDPVHNVTVKVTAQQQRRGSAKYSITAYDNGQKLSKPTIQYALTQNKWKTGSSFTGRNITEFWIRVSVDGTWYNFTWNKGVIS